MPKEVACSEKSGSRWQEIERKSEGPTKQIQKEVSATLADITWNHATLSLCARCHALRTSDAKGLGGLGFLGAVLR